MDVIVVGGGIGGLTCATLLARRGASVTLVERSEALGGRARTTARGGFLWNQGPHALYRNGTAHRLLRELDVPVIGGAPRTKGWIAAGDRLHTLPAGPISLLTTGFLDAAEAWEAGKVLARVSTLAARDGESTGAFLERTIRHPKVRALVAMTMMVATYTYPVDTLPAAVSMAQLRTALGPGVLYLDGGWQSIVDALRARAVASGVAIETHAAVERIEVRNGRAVGVTHRGGRVDAADHVVLAVGPRSAASLVPDDDALREAATAEPVQAACLDVALERTTSPATILLGVDQPYYASVHSAVAALAPAPGAVVHVMKYLAPGASATEAELRAILERLQPGARVVDSRFLPRIVVMNARIPRGGLGQRIERPTTEGLDLVGDWVGPEGLLLDAVVASAQSAAARIASRLAESA